jgi:hypothetical protein
LITLTITNVQELATQLGAIASDQLPYVTAVALTKTAKGAQQAIQTQVLPAHFELRRTAWMQRNIRVEPATKAKPLAIVKDTYAPMGLQESGGVKLPYKQFLAVPLKGARPSPRALPSPLPHEVMAMGGFIRGQVMYLPAYKGKSRNARLGLTRHAPGQAFSRDIIPMYALVPRANIPAIYGFEPAVMRTVVETFAANFSEVWRAVRTAR